MKTNNQTTTTKGNETRKALQELMQERNNLIQNGLAQDPALEKINAELLQTISEIATRKTLVFLQANNATNGTATESTDNGTTNTRGYNMSVQLLNTLYHDIQLLHNPDLSPDTLTDSADLIQESIKALTPFFCSPIAFSLDDTIYTKVLKNGTEKNYTAFQFACKSIREYITAQDKRQYKKLSYIVGYTDNGTEILTTKKPKNDITDIDNEKRTAFLNRYRLTDTEQTALANLLNGKSTTETADQLQVSKRTIERALKSAREKIAKVDKRIQL